MGKQVSIGVQQELKDMLDKLKTHHRDSYGDIILKLIQEHEKRVIPNSAINSEKIANEIASVVVKNTANTVFVESELT